MFCRDGKSLLKTQVNGKDVLDDVNVLLKCCIYYLVVNKLFLNFYMSVKEMFLSIPDSVMISHI